MDFGDAKTWLYRAQQRLAITRSEATALLSLAALLGAGMVARYVQGRPRAAPGSPFAATDHRFQQSAARLRAARGDTTEGAAPPQEPAPSMPLAPSSSAPLNLNAASPAQMERLPGVGPVIARRVAAYRARHGPFAEAAHLQRVSGIGPKTMARLDSLVAARPPDSSRGR